MIGTYIKLKREKLNISQKELSDKLNISIQRLTNFESETRTPSLELLGDLSNTLNFDIDNINKRKKTNKTFNIDLFKENISNYRIKNKLTLQNLSDKINISRQTISKWEKGETYPNIDTFYNACNTLKIKPSSLVCATTKNKFNPLFLLILPPLLLLTLLIPQTQSSAGNLVVLPEKPKETTNGIINEVIPVLDKQMSESSIELITKSTEAYNKSNNKQYTISFNDNNIDDIKYNPNEPFYLPYYFDDEKYIDHYLYNNEILSGLTTLTTKENITLTPVYITYEQYLNSLTIETVAATQLIELNNNNIYTYIIPENLFGLNSFEIRTIPPHIKTLICNYSNLVFNGVEIDYLPNTIFINCKNLEFINNKTYESVHFTAINQTNEYNKQTTFPNVLIKFLYINNNDKYTNTVTFNSVEI